jgi:anti-sigma B factor antagonist
MVDLNNSGENALFPAAERLKPPSFSAELHSHNPDEPVVVAKGEVDMATAPTLWEVVTEALERSPSRLVLDLTDVSFMDSTGLKAVLHARRSLPPDRTVVLRRPQPAVRMVFEVTGLTDLFEIEDVTREG